MDPLEFAQRYLQPFTVKGEEIVPTLCPFCHGGSHHDKYTFALNQEKRTYNCKRGSCGEQGHFTQLCRRFGEMAGAGIRPAKQYKKPEKPPERITETALGYLQARCISPETAQAYRVGVDEQGNLMFPFYTQGGEHVFTKYRPARKLKPGERKAWRDTDTMPVLFGMHLCDPEIPLLITEGELDAMACHEAGIPNATSVPSGAEDFTWLDTCWDFIHQFKQVCLFGDNDAAGLEMIRRLCAKLSGMRVFVVEHECKDANELLFRHGKQRVMDAWLQAKAVPVAGLINLADVSPMDPMSVKTVTTGIAPLNKMLGGFGLGDVSVWTGKRGDGKSTLLSQLMLDAVDADWKVCAYSGELRADRYQYWTDLQAAGTKHIREYLDTVNDRPVYYVPKEIRQRIHAWYDERYWLFDNALSATEEEANVLSVFELGAMRYDCKVFLVDNLMTADFGRVSDSDFYRQQSRFVGKLVSFANRFNVHVHLVAHPRKTRDAITGDDISGSGDITNRVANVLSLSRREKPLEGLTLEIIKNRWEGQTGKIQMEYSPVSHRLYLPERGEEVTYGWMDKPMGMWEVFDAPEVF